MHVKTKKKNIYDATLVAEVEVHQTWKKLASHFGI